MRTAGRLGSYGRRYTSGTSSMRRTNSADRSGGMRPISLGCGLSPFF